MQTHINKTGINIHWNIIIFFPKLSSFLPNISKLRLTCCKISLVSKKLGLIIHITIIDHRLLLTEIFYKECQTELLKKTNKSLSGPERSGQELITCLTYTSRWMPPFTRLPKYLEIFIPDGEVAYLICLLKLLENWEFTNSGGSQ